MSKSTKTSKKSVDRSSEPVTTDVVSLFQLSIPIKKSNKFSVSLRSRCSARGGLKPLIPMRKATMSFEKKRADVLGRVAATAQGESKKIRFVNHDVPKFLKRLARFDAASRKAVLVAR